MWDCPRAVESDLRSKLTCFVFGYQEHPTEGNDEALFCPMLNGERSSPSGDERARGLLGIIRRVPTDNGGW